MHTSNDSLAKADLRLPFFFSFLLHLSIFILFSLKNYNQARNIYIPIQLMTMQGGAETDTAEEEPVKKEEVIAAKEIAVKKNNDKPKKNELKEVPSNQNPGQPGGQPGAPMSLENPNFPYMYYLSQIKNKIWNNWTIRQGNSLKSIVYFRILKNGEITGLKVKDSSGDRMYDEFCMRAISLSEPFPPLPSDFQDSYLGVFFNFELQGQ